jgi:DNA polymerase-1
VTLFGPEPTDWKPAESLPSLAAYSELWVDYEADGKDPHTSKPVGLAICAPDDHAWYMPFRHADGNLDERAVKEWARRELRGKTLIGSWIKIDSHFSRNWGLPFDELDVRLRDVQHQACLLDERRRRSGLDLLASELLGQKKLALPFDLDTTRMTEVHSSVVGPYAIQDVRLTKGVDLAQRPLIEKEDLGRVLELEDSIILAVVEMEANGAPLDMPLLEQWQQEVRADWQQALAALRDEAGFAVNPGSFPDMKRLWTKLGLPFPTDPEDGKVSFSREALLKCGHPIVALVLKVNSRSSLLSKYLDKYAAGHRGGILRYSLHQLRADDTGTITGRFSSAAVDKDTRYGANIQQVFHPEKQAKKLGTDRWPIRQLFIPARGKTWVSADAKQIEYRLFAHLANNPSIIRAFEQNPDVDYHGVVTQMVHTIGVDMPRVLVKNVNFARIYGAGVRKIARMLGKSQDEAKTFLAAYDRAFPEVAPLIQRVSDEITRRARAEGMGYVKTMLGRRRRYHKNEEGEIRQLHSGLNAWDQGTAADIMKMKIRDVYRERKHLGLTMRMTVHDALEGDLENPEKARDLRDLLDQPAIALRVPIRWDVELGANWADLVKLDKYLAPERQAA